MRLDVAFDEVLPHPIEAVWAELTDADAISDWLMKTSDFKPVIGSRFRMKTEDLSSTGWVEAGVLELEPPHRMVWSWSGHDGNPPSTVTFDLTQEGKGTRLRLTHVGEMNAEVARILRDGWPGRIAAMADAIRRVGDG